jgi:hypothetical protein
MGNEQQVGSAREWYSGDEAMVGDIRVTLVDRTEVDSVISIAPTATVAVWMVRRSEGQTSMVVEEDLRPIPASDERTWSDQPEALHGARSLLKAQLGCGAMVQVMRDPETKVYYVTTGNLFGSETVRTGDEETTWRLLRAVAELEEGETLSGRDLAGVERVANASEPREGKRCYHCGVGGAVALKAMGSAWECEDENECRDRRA